MTEIIKIIFIFIISILFLFLPIYLYNSLNIKKEYRFLHHTHILVLLIDIFSISSVYLIIYILSLFNNNALNLYNRLTSSNIILTLILSIYLLYKSIYKIYYSLYEDKITNKEHILPKHYYYKDNNYYLSSYYITLSKVFKYSYITIIIILSILIASFDYIYDISFKDIIKIISSFTILLVLLSELSIYFNGQLEDISIKNRNRRNKKDNILWNSLDEEYRKLWKEKLLSSYNVVNKYDTKIIDGVSNIDKVSMNVTKGISDNNAKDLVYGKILSSISNGKNLIIESCLIESFSNIIIPIFNIKFTASKKILILTDSYNSVGECSKWLEKYNITNSDIVVDILSNNNNTLIKQDNKVDIYVGTVDLVLNNRNIFENIDVVFCLNIDKIITENALNLNLLASFLSGKSNSVQYVMFGNRVNGLIQTISQVLMKNNFEYQTIENGLEKQINVNFWKKEGEWFQEKVLSGIVSNNLGQLIPLSLPAFKLGIEKVNVISSEQSLSDQLISLQTTTQTLKKYINKDIVNLNDAIIISQNENFIELDNNSVLVVEDNYNNAALVLLNYLKYTKTNMYLNVVTKPYILRDYIISNIDFFVNNVEVIGNILPISKTNNKLSLYRIINQLCYGFISEDILLDEIKKLDRNINIDIFENNQERFITNKLQKLIKDIFEVDIYLKSYLDINKYSKTNEVREKQYYKLLDSVKYELPERLFKNITFIDSEQSAKVLKRIPVFELYQNYLEGQYMSFDGKYYLIDRIDYDNGIVNLVYSNNIENNCYRQCREITNINHIGISKELSSLKVNNSILKKSILCAELDVNTNGYYIFNNEISFKPGTFGYKEIDTNKKGLSRQYKGTNVLTINISNENIINMNEEDKFKLSFTFSVLLNEIFETLFSNIKQYILVRSVINDEKIYSKYNNEELIKLYKPIIDTNISDGINIYITEDTELEKGFSDTIIDNFDNIIIPLLHDYLYWLLKEDTIINEDKWYETIGDYINLSNIDKLSFLKYGNDNIYEYLDLNGLFNCLDELIIQGNQRLTTNRIDFINKRVIDDEFNISLIDIVEKKNNIKNVDNKSKVKKDEDKSLIQRIKEFFSKRKKNKKKMEQSKEIINKNKGKSNKEIIENNINNNKNNKSNNNKVNQTNKKQDNIKSNL